jgi:thioredoxin-like negative regulator of GroEL
MGRPFPSRQCNSPLTALAAVSVLGLGCAGTPAPRDGAQPQSTATTSSAASAAPQNLTAQSPTDASSPAPTAQQVHFMPDDFAGALARAKREGKVVFVDAWAPWCHTCLSMDNFVLNQPALRRFESRVVFAKVDTDREENGAFAAKYAMDVWPTLFVIDPDKGELLSVWTGAASLREVEQLLDESLAIADLKKQNKLDPNSPEGLLLAAQRAALADRWAEAAANYDKSLRAAPGGWARRSEALFGWIKSLHNARRARECAEVGEKYAKEIHGAALPGDFGRYWFSCATGLPLPKRKAEVRAAAILHLRKLVEQPPAESSTDDIADAWDILADALRQTGDEGGFRKAHERRLLLLEAAAKAAPSPAAAATFDYARAGSYTVLGRSAEAVAMLQARVRELPDSYEPSARLASLLHGMGRDAEARPAIDKVLKLAYGPRRMSYLVLKAKIEHKLGNSAGRIAALEEEVRAWQGIQKRTGVAPAGLNAALKRLAAAKAER